MNNSPRSAERFVDAVHRRWIIVGSAEQLGRGMLLGSLLAIALLPVAVWQALPTWPILLFSGVLGLFIGGILAVYRKPTRLAAAAEADRQLRFDDLLTSAVYPADRADADFQAMIKNMADAQCAAHSPSEVLLRRFGIRSWGGVAFAMSLAVTLAVIPFEPSRSQAVDANASVLSAIQAEPSQVMQANRGIVPVVNDPMSEGSSSGSTQTQTTAGNDAASAQTPGTSGQGNSGGAGGGKAVTAGRTGHDLPTGESTGRTSNQLGTAAGGGAVSSRKDEHGDSSAGSTGTSSQTSDPVPAWTGSSPSESAGRGMSADERIPAEDRDLVRDFFKR